MDVELNQATFHGRFKKMVMVANGFLLLLAILVNFSDIISRNLLGTSLPWAHKTTVWLVILTCYLALGPQLKDGTHIRVEFIYEKFKGTSKYVVDLISHLCILTFAMMATVSGILMVMHAFKGGFTETMGSWYFPLWVTYFVCFLIGAFIMTAYSVYLFVSSVNVLFVESTDNLTAKV